MEFRLLRPDEVEVRIGQKIGKKKDGISLLLYKNARADMNILDETVGAENWQRAQEIVGGNLYCNVGIWVNRRGDGYGDWVWKQDVGTESNTEKEKGQASDAFKRACSNWGIGRELYTSPRMQLWDGQFNPNYEAFTCTKIEYDGRRIRSVTIKVKSTGKEHTFSHDTSIIEPVETNVEKVNETELKELRETLSKTQTDWALSRFRVNDLSELTSDQCEQILSALERRKTQNE